MKRVALACVLLLMSIGLRAQAPGPLLLVLNKNAATLSIVDPRTGATTATIATGRNPHEVAATADGRLAVTSNYGGDSLSVIELATGKELHRASGADLRQPHGITMAGGLAIVTVEANRAIVAYDPAANRIVWRFATGQDGTHMVVASRDARTLFTANIGSNSITVLERANDSWRPTHIAVGAAPEGLDLSPDGRELWTAHSGDGGVSIVDVATKKVTHRFDAATKRSNRLKFTRDGRHVLISDLDGGELVIVDARTRTVTRRVRLGLTPEGILVPPEGDRVFVAVTGENRVAAIDTSTFAIVQSITAGSGPDGMAWVAAPGTR
jgi:YVTN family beta-propeller protein